MKKLLFLLIPILALCQTEPNDANTVAYYKLGVGHTMNGSTVLTWADQANDWDLTQTTSANQATRDDDSLYLSFDATNDEYIKTSFTDFSTEGTVDIWVDASADVGTRLIFQLRVDANNNVQFQRRTGPESVVGIYKAGGEEENYALVTVAGWNLYTITWTKAGDDTVRYILNGVSKAIDIGTGTWVGTPSIMVASNDGSLYFDGSIGEVRISNKKRTVAETLAYYNYISAWPLPGGYENRFPKFPDYPKNPRH
jgi:hypothetical protein